MTTEQYILKYLNWQVELEMLQSILIKTELEVTIKWGIPVYTFQAKNIVGLAAFKNYVGLWFYQGALLADNRRVLINAQEGKTHAMRQWRFTSIIEIDEKLVLRYLQEAIENQKQGKEIKPQKKPLIIPSELKEAITQDVSLSEAFEDLNLTKKRDYCTYITEAKRAETKKKRLAKIIPMIVDGVGLNDKYKN